VWRRGAQVQGVPVMREKGKGGACGKAAKGASAREEASMSH